MIRLYTGILAVLLMLSPLSANAFDHSYKQWNHDLEKYNENGFVHYGVWKENRSSLDRHIKLLKMVDSQKMQRWNRAQTYAFWINTYNAIVVSTILDHYPSGVNPRRVSIDGMYDKRQWNVAGQELTLNDIRDHILRKASASIIAELTGKKTAMGAGRDLRLLFAINDGTLNSAPLRAEAYTPKKLNRQLDDQSRKTIRTADFVKIIPSQKTFKLGYLFKRFKSDFDRYEGHPILFSRSSLHDRGVQRFVYHYLSEDVQKEILSRQKAPWRINYAMHNAILNGGD